ncbi:DUF6527 family protein [Marinobacter sp. JSM 1782161]|uniref:DUF6527 family protein n=1 Tax=Marinobacter sp. JSM 1782161 TaxID=2685906 RepID=UPI003A4C6079
MGLLKNWLHKVLAFFSSRPSLLSVEIIKGDVFPKQVPKGRIVLLEDDGFYAVAFLCPCGCGESIELMVMDGVNPRWSIEIDKRGKPTLSPSIWRTAGCRSHFWVRHGQVVWCN